MKKFKITYTDAAGKIYTDTIEGDDLWFADAVVETMERAKKLGGKASDPQYIEKPGDLSYLH